MGTKLSADIGQNLRGPKRCGYFGSYIMGDTGGLGGGVQMTRDRVTLIKRTLNINSLLNNGEVFSYFNHWCGFKKT